MYSYAIGDTQSHALIGPPPPPPSIRMQHGPIFFDSDLKVQVGLGTGYSWDTGL